MIRMQEWPLWRQVMAWMAGIWLVSILVMIILVGRLYIASAESRARTVANIVEDVGTWAGKYGGVWARSAPGPEGDKKVGDFLESMIIVGQAVQSSGPVAEGGFHRKNPALLQRELSEVTNSHVGRGAKFRMTSDKFMNARNSPNHFELQAIESIRESGATELSEVRGNRLLYARRLDVTSGCMSCHDTPERAPLSVRTRYSDPTRGYGYKLGDVAGVISVEVPIVDGSDPVSGMMGPTGWGALALLAAVVGGFLWFLRQRVIQPIHAMSMAASSASMTDAADLRLLDFGRPAGSRHSRNEMDALSAAFRRLLRSVQVQRRAKS